MKLTSKINWTLEKERQQGHYGESYKLIVKGRKANFEAFLDSGLSDSIDVYRDGDFNVYALSQNYSLDYIGLQIFNGEGEEVGSVFFQDATYNLEYDYRERGSVYNIKTLSNYIY